ncbi:helix-turn-helix transcriptional regulator [Streptomyces polygonati]|uniref:Helix-turn-helix transcriptional regulator n=1 Tax=Streptomyces polygonati TaxID=1617087 RepID=A0ABV8HG68_9ACTN
MAGSRKGWIVPERHAEGRRTEGLVTVEEFLERVGVSRRTFNRWRELGTAPLAIKLPKGQLRMRQGDVESWLSDHEEAAA